MTANTATEDRGNLLLPEPLTNQQYVAASTLRQVLNPGVLRKLDGTIEVRPIDTHALAVAIVSVINTVHACAEYAPTRRGGGVRVLHPSREMYVVPGGVDSYDHDLLKAFAYWVLARSGVSRSGRALSPEEAAERAGTYAARLPERITASHDQAAAVAA